MKIKISIKLLSPLLIGSSDDIYGLAKSQLEYDDMALISGSELKGNFRYIFKSLPSLNEFTIPLFGDTLHGGKLSFENLKLKTPNYIERTGVSIDRTLGIAANEKLFTVRAVDKNSTFEGYINVNGELSESEKLSLITASNIIDKIGSMKSRGFGKVKIYLDFVENANSNHPNIDEGIYKIVFKVKSPIILTYEMAKTYLYTSRNFVSGETLKGAYVKFFDKDSVTFKQIFNEGTVHFPFLYPSNKTESLIPAPQTLFTLKHSNENMIYDITLGKYTEQILAEHGFKAVLTDKAINNGNETRLEPFKGYFEIESQKPLKISPRKFFSTQIEIDPFTKTAKSGILRSYNTFYPDYLVGYLKVNSRNKEMINEILKHKEIQIGNSKTRGFGYLELDSVDKIEINLAESLTLANKTFKEVLERINKMNNTKEFEVKKAIVPIVLTSDLIEKDFGNLLGSDFKLKLSFTKRQSISGYNAHSFSNKTLYNSIVAGSVFLFESDRDIDTISEFLKQKKDEGLGYLSESGFGDFDVYVPLKNAKGRE